jgi:hypothetical protein
MRRHSMICRYGFDDRAQINVAEPTSHQTTLQYVTSNRGFGYGVGNTVTRLKQYGIWPSETAFDLLILAATVYCADTRINRRSEAQDSWSREVDIYLPVAAPDRWTAASARISHALEFLTGDKWRLYVRERPRGFSAIIGRPQFAAANLPDCICLFSGGLDSFIGAIDLIEEGRDPVLASHGWVANASAHQGACERALRLHYAPRRIRRVKSSIGFRKGTVEGGGAESTERSRSFLFFAIAVLAASGLSEQPAIIYVPENGLISLNIPLDPLRLGALSTRTTHPYFMEQFEVMLRQLGIHASLENPYRHQTKGAMVRGCRNQTLLARNLTETMSCSSPNKGRWSGESPGHCGYCLPCLIRRAALLNSTVPDPTTYHLPNLHQRVLNSREAEGDNIRSFQLAIAHLNNNAARAKVLIHKSGPLTRDAVELANLARVYLAGMQEVAALLAGVQTRP